MSPGALLLEAVLGLGIALVVLIALAAGYQPLEFVYQGF